MTATDRDPVSVLLPTVEWTPACDELAGQLRAGDELLVICDSESDPVAGRDPPENVEILTAGEPEGCSGKANAMAHGMERAANDRFVWTDADYERGDEWLDRLAARGREHGPTSVLPYFIGSGWWLLFEPILVLLLGLQHGLFRSSDDAFAWGGGVTFTREELAEGVPALVRDLRRCLSDDIVLDDHLGACRIEKSMPVTVRVDGSASAVYHRLVRWMRADHVHGGLLRPFVGSLGIAAAAALSPFGVAAAVTLAALAAYYSLGLVRPTFLLAYPALFVLPLLLLAGILVETCEWGGRRYRIRDAYDIEVLR